MANAGAELYCLSCVSVPQTVKYNTKKRAGRGFTLEELKVRGLAVLEKVMAVMLCCFALLPATRCGGAGHCSAMMCCLLLYWVSRSIPALGCLASGCSQRRGGYLQPAEMQQPAAAVSTAQHSSTAWSGPLKLNAAGVSMPGG